MNFAADKESKSNNFLSCSVPFNLANLQALVKPTNPSKLHKGQKFMERKLRMTSKTRSNQSTGFAVHQRETKKKKKKAIKGSERTERTGLT